MHHVPELRTIYKADPPVVLWLASVKQWKRPELFLELVDILADQPYRFVLAGRMVDTGHYLDLIRRYERQYVNFEYRSNVAFEESNRLIGEATVFVNTSLPYEGFPNTFIQAWLRKTPTVSLGFDPDHLIAQHGIGAVAPHIEDLAQHVMQIVSDPVARESMGVAARKFAQTAFGLENNFYKLENIALSYVS
jgi:glycosyltransferase involved in cell wall biosynthesis